MQPDTPWTRLASRVIRVALARKDVSYQQLVSAMAASGSSQTERALVSKIFRGTPKLSLLLQIIDVSGAQPPALWTQAIRVNGTWEDRAAAVLASELARQPWVTPKELVRRIRMLGTEISESVLTTHLTEGTASLALALQCLTVLGSTSLERYIDNEDLIEAARMSSVGEP
ncbi:DUF6471 domain-containing protein [Paraburkholderia caribensis]|uniref:DUF6471 domain-containing protein n=1 Tax=Paraburkholderia caribensis TaxID=75105 RepID=UPI001D06A2EA